MYKFSRIADWFHRIWAYLRKHNKGGDMKNSILVEKTNKAVVISKPSAKELAEKFLSLKLDELKASHAEIVSACFKPDPDRLQFTLTSRIELPALVQDEHTFEVEFVVKPTIFEPSVASPESYQVENISSVTSPLSSSAEASNPSAYDKWKKRHNIK